MVYGSFKFARKEIVYLLTAARLVVQSCHGTARMGKMHMVHAQPNIIRPPSICLLVRDYPKIISVCLIYGKSSIIKPPL